MIISKVEAFLMSYPMREKLTLPFWGGIRTILKRDAMLIRVKSNTGLKGFAPGPAHSRALREINVQIASFLEGKDPLKWRNFGFAGDDEVMKTYKAVEMAILDLVSQFEECPVSQLLGGRKREKIKLYGSAGMYMSSDNYAIEAVGIHELGFPAYKFRPAKHPEGNLEIVEKIHQATKGRLIQMIDAHTWWRMGDLSFTKETVLKLIREIHVYGPYWLEEPLVPDDHAGYSQLRAERKIPIASGEHEQDMKGFKDLVENEAVDFVQMDVCCQGGFSGAMEIINLVERHGLKFAFHCWGTLLEVIAAAHLGICFDNSVVEWLEFPCYSNHGRVGMYPFPLSDEILSEELEIVNGFLHVPRENGWGVKINESIIEKYPFIAGPWSYFDLRSPQKRIVVTGDHSIKWLPHLKDTKNGNT
jgi:L-alanine-DL-glutamate epimerase-like enolase superfamily enzyme